MMAGSHWPKAKNPQRPSIPRRQRAEIRRKLTAIELTLEQIEAETEVVTYLGDFRKSNPRRAMISLPPLVIQSITGIRLVVGYLTYYLQLAVSCHLTKVPDPSDLAGGHHRW